MYCFLPAPTLSILLLTIVYAIKKNGGDSSIVLLLSTLCHCLFFKYFLLPDHQLAEKSILVFGFYETRKKG